MKNSLTIYFALFLGTNIFAQEDHSGLIEGPFENPKKVTETCLSCHEDVDKEIMNTRHWNWLGNEFISKDGKKMKFGKQNIINNYCI